MDEQETTIETIKRLREKGRAILGRAPRPDEKFVVAKKSKPRVSQYNRFARRKTKAIGPKGKVNN